MHNLLRNKLLKLDPTIIDILPPRSLVLQLGDEKSIDDVTEVIKGTT